MFLAADIGGTKTLLALGDGDCVRLQRRYDNDAHAGPGQLIAEFLREAEAAGLAPATATCLALAGPIDAGGRRGSLTNRAWTVDAEALARTLPVGPVTLMNDFAAGAAGIASLRPEERVTLQAGEPDRRAASLAIGPGTGLGVAALLPRSSGPELVLASEGGHVGFSPIDEEQLGLLHFMRSKGGPSAHVGVETIVSGPGLRHCYAYCAGMAPGRDDLPTPAEISGRALDGSDPRCARALDLFLGIFGAYAGDMALCFLAQGGVYLAGGIVPKVLPRLLSGSFLAAFGDKSKHKALLARTPVHAVLAEDITLRGALAHARAMPASG